MTEGASESGIPPKADGDSGLSAAPSPVKRPRRRRTGLIAVLSFLFVIFAGLGGALYVTGAKLRLPVWMVAEAEARLNAGLAETLPDIALAIGGVQIGFDGNGIPQLAIEDARLLHRQGAPILVLPEARVRLDGAALLQGDLRPLRLTVVGANLSLTRRADGSLDLSLGDQLRLRGRGLDTLLKGDLKLSTPAGRLNIDGTVRAEQGSYLAYGQKLEIERGVLVFSGRPENPRLDVLAVRDSKREALFKESTALLKVLIAPVSVPIAEIRVVVAFSRLSS